MNWYDDKEFCAWLVHMNYAEKTNEGHKCKLTTGLRCYIWEAWQAAKGRHVDGWCRKA